MHLTLMPTLLFVDDEPLIRETMPAILKMYGFETTAVATVSEALTQITTRSFDVLISDLNIGEPGDGFTVVSAMRRVQPMCHTFILTGFPALDSALRAIRSQVDGYIVKPADIPELINILQRKLKEPKLSATPQGRRVSAVLRDNIDDILARTLANMKADQSLAALPLSDDQRVDHLPPMIQELTLMLESAHPNQTTPEAMKAARERGESTFQQGYSVEMLITASRMFVRALNDVINEQLLSVDLSNLMGDLKWLDESVSLQLEETIRSYLRFRDSMAV